MYHYIGEIILFVTPSISLAHASFPVRIPWSPKVGVSNGEILGGSWLLKKVKGGQSYISGQSSQVWVKLWWLFWEICGFFFFALRITFGEIQDLDKGWSYWSSVTTPNLKRFNVRCLVVEPKNRGHKVYPHRPADRPQPNY